MAKIDLTFNAGKANVIPHTYNQVEVAIEEVDPDDILDSVDIADVISFYGEDKLLDKIGREAAVDHFDIEEAE
jgi:hypothetical protein